MARRPIDSRESVVVHTDDPMTGDRIVGTLHATRSRGLSAISFGYDSGWIASGFPLDPTFPLFRGDVYLSGGSLRGFLSDAAPDRWGRMLMERKEVATADREGRSAAPLTDWDFLLRVGDETRMGALRIERPGEGFVAGRENGVPPIVGLREIEEAARIIERGTGAPSELASLALLLEPGSSMGGARPKATFLAKDGSLFLAKFPSRNDRRDVAAWEHLVTRMAADAGIEVPETSLLELGSEHRTFCARRFDRAGDRRIGYISAMSMLGLTDGDRASYLDIAQAIEINGSTDHVTEDLERCFRRVVYNVLIGDRDDHLRNHGFLRRPEGWRLSPAFDLNPNTDKQTHSLALDDASDIPDLDTVRKTAVFYRLSPAQATRSISAITDVVEGWRDRARSIGIARSEIAAVAPSFMVG